MIRFLVQTYKNGHFILKISFSKNPKSPLWGDQKSLMLQKQPLHSWSLILSAWSWPQVASVYQQLDSYPEIRRFYLSFEEIRKLEKEHRQTQKWFYCNGFFVPKSHPNPNYHGYQTVKAESARKEVSLTCPPMIKLLAYLDGCCNEHSSVILTTPPGSAGRGWFIKEGDSSNLP